MKIPVRLPVLVALMALAACSQSKGLGNDIAIDSNEVAERPVIPGARPVRIGDAGPLFPACNATAIVVNVAPGGETYLPVRAAPFAESDELSRLANGTRVFVCTRSLDQRWAGIVVPAVDAADSDCGVATPVSSPRAYQGPCVSGWVSASFLRISAR